MPRDKKTELLQGTLDMLVLKVLTSGPLHGYSIAKRIQLATEDVLRVEEGSLYPALHRMERRGWLTSEWGPSETNRRAKFYRITRTGRTQLQAQAEAWERVSGAIARVMGTHPEGG